MCRDAQDRLLWKDKTCTYLAHDELESVVIFIFICVAWMLPFSALSPGAIPGRPDVIEPFSASLRSISIPEGPAILETKHTQTELQQLQRELVTDSCMPFHSRVPVPGRTA